MKKYIIFSLLSVTLLLNSCGIYKPVDARKIPNTAEERARKNIEEGRGISINSLVKGRNREFEFSSSNPLWRASLEILDFLPLNTVDYSCLLYTSDAADE